MQNKENNIAEKWNSMTKPRKFNIMLIVVAFLSLGLVPVFAAGNAECKINFSVDMSGSIADTDHGGSVANAEAIRNGLKSAVTDVSAKYPKAQFSFTLYASRGVNQQPYGFWGEKNVALAYINALQWVQKGDKNIGAIPYSAAPKGAEKGTNWEEGLRLPRVVTNFGVAKPDGIVFFTDGNPTTDTAEMNRRVNGGPGSIPNIFEEGNPSSDPWKTHLAAAQREYNANTAAGIKTFGVSIIQDKSNNRYQYAEANIKKVSSPGGVYGSYNSLAPKLKEYANQICATKNPTTTTTAPPTTQPPTTVQPPADTGYIWVHSYEVKLDNAGKYAGSKVEKSLGGFTYGIPGAKPATGTTKAASDPANTGNFLVDLNNEVKAGYTLHYEVSKNKEYNVTQSGGDGVNTILYDRYCYASTQNNPGKGNAAGTSIKTNKIDVATVCNFVQAKPAVELTKTIKEVRDSKGKAKANSTSVNKGDVVVYEFSLKNTGTAPLRNLKITDTVLPGSQDFSTTVNSESSGDILYPGKVQKVAETYDYKVLDTATLGDLVNKAEVVGDALNVENKKAGEAKDDATVTIKVDAGDFTVLKTGPSYAVPGSNGEYKITIHNTGANTINNITWSDEKLKALKDSGVITTSDPLSGTVASLASDAKKVITIKVKFTDDKVKFNEAFADGVFVNTAKVCIEGNTDCKTDDFETPVPEIELIKEGPESVIPGETYQYTFAVKNVGKVALSKIVINDDTIAKITGKKATISFGDLVLKPGETSEIKTLSVTLPKDYKGSTFKNVAVVTGQPVDEDGKVGTEKVTDDDDHTVKVPSFEVTKKANKDVFIVGEEITYTVTVKNTSDVTLKNLEITDPSINMLEAFIIEELAAGAEASHDYKYIVPSDIKAPFKNVALVCLPYGDDNVIPNEEDPSNKNLTKEDALCKEPEFTIDIAKISLQKTADKKEAAPGDKVIYTFEIFNNGSVTIDPDVLVDDVLGEIGDPTAIEPGKSVKLTKEYTVPEDADIDSEIVNIASVCAPVPGDVKGDLSDDISLEDDATFEGPLDNIKTDAKDVKADDVKADEEATNVCDSSGDTIGKGTCPDAVETQTLCAQATHTLKIVTPTTVAGEVVERGAEVLGATLPFTGSLAEMIAKTALWIIAIGSLALFLTRNKKKSKKDELLARLNV